MHVLWSSIMEVQPIMERNQFPERPHALGWSQHACVMDLVHACTMAIVRACTMAIMHTCSMTIINVCTMAEASGCVMVIKYINGPLSYYMHVLWPCMYNDHHTCMHYEHSTCMYYGHGRCSTIAIIHACTMAMVHAWIMAIAPAFTMALVLAWSMGIIRACTAIVHALHACTLQKMIVSCMNMFTICAYILDVCRRYVICKRTIFWSK